MCALPNRGQHQPAPTVMDKLAAIDAAEVSLRQAIADLDAAWGKDGDLATLAKSLMQISDGRRLIEWAIGRLQQARDKMPVPKLKGGGR
ncbi:MAG: hypothetical protein JWO38_4907 [Gemmataceae bacterium]|nr:hypothetical protein [Gemmataceae bacterium]